MSSLLGLAVIMDAMETLLGLAISLQSESSVLAVGRAPAMGLPVAVPKLLLAGDLVDLALPVLPAPAFTTVGPFVFDDF